MKLDPKKAAKMASDTFLETLKEARGISGDRRSLSSELRPGESVDLRSVEEKAAELERQYYEKFYHQAEHLRREEKGVYDSKERQLELQVKALQEELNEMAKATGQLEKEIKIAAFQAPVKPGIYHVRFFEKLRHFVKSFRAKIESSAAWLAAFNQRSKKRNYYWAQVRKSGTKFMLSGERYMATQAG